MTVSGQFKIGATRDFLNSSGSLVFGDIGLDRLKSAQHTTFEFLPDYGEELPASVGRDFDGLLVLAPKVTSVTVSTCERLKIVARFGVGYDNVDVEACTEADVVLTITPDGVRRPVAVAALAMLLALSHRLLEKDRLTREGRWNQKLDYMGMGLTGRKLGLVGFGNIGQEIAKIVAPLDMRLLTHDPMVSAPAVNSLGVKLVDLEQLLSDSDFVCICCSLTGATRHLLNATRLSLMKPSAFLINVSRGPIIDQNALTVALQQRRIAGAALDVFEREPIDPNDPLLTLENVILSPHAICWTDELFRGNGRAAIDAICEVARGRIPQGVVNRDVIERPTFQTRLARAAVDL